MLFRKKPNFLAFCVLAKALLPAKLLFREWPRMLPLVRVKAGVEEAAGGCHAVMGCVTVPARVVLGRMGTWSGGCEGGKSEAEVLAADAALRKACICGGSLAPAAEEGALMVSAVVA